MANLKTSLQKLLPATRKSGRLPAAQDREPIPAGQGVGKRVAAAGSSTGTGISWPLTETSETRTYHPVSAITSSDGLFAWEYEHIETLSFTDGDNQPGQVTLEDV